MGILRRFWDWLTGKSRRGIGPRNPDLYPIDVDQLSRELRLAEKAERLGKAGLPASGAQTLSGPEAAIVQRVEKARQDYVDWAVRRLNTLSDDIARRSAIRALSRAKDADKEFERKASSLMAEHEALLRTLAESAKSRRAELSDFRMRNGLEREAEYPTGSAWFLRIGILLVLIIVEGVVNARFFAEGLDEGLLGGFIQAGMLAAINVVSAFFLGKYFVRYIYHSHLPQKLAGIVSLMFSIALMCAIGMGIAHYRDSLTAGLEAPAQEVLRLLRENPLGLKDIFSWILFGVSVAFALGSLIDGLSSDDRYPGYGSLSRATTIVIDDYEDELSSLRRKLEEMKEEELESLERTLQGAQLSTTGIESSIADKLAAKTRLNTALHDADHSLYALLQIFRSENEIHRGSAARPRYFDTRPELNPLEVPDFDTGRDETIVKEQRALVSALLDEVQDIRGRIQAAFTRQFDQLDPLDMHFPDKDAG
jgi:hypothetical protein